MPLALSRRHNRMLFIRFHPFLPALSHPIERSTPCTFQPQQLRSLHPFQQVLGLPFTQVAQAHDLCSADLPMLLHVTQHHLLMLYRGETSLGG